MRSSGFSGLWPSRRGFFITGSRELEAILVRRKVLRVYSGHIHTLAYTEIHGVRYVISGGGGSVMYKGFPVVPGMKAPHYLYVEAGPYGIYEEIVFLDGSRKRFLE